MLKTFLSFCFGCRVNQAEQEAINNKLLKSGLILKEDSPDIFIINSCAVTAKAEREVGQLINKLKRKSPRSKIVLTGCAGTYWQKYKDHKISSVDLIINNLNKVNLSEIIIKRLIHPRGDFEDITKDISSDKNKYLNSKRILIKIQDGCHRFCTYCIVPYLRGIPKSTPIKNIIRQIKEGGQNMNEVILVAVNTEAYGKDTNESILDLLKKILSQTEIKRVSFGSIHPLSVDSSFIKFYRNNIDSNRLVHFLHIPLQSGSDKILKLMKRDYTRKISLEKLMNLQKVNPFMFLGTDIIVGFLEETDKDFQDTYDFLEKSPISKFHVFRFSNRVHTAAYILSKSLNEPDPDQKKRRMKALLELGKQKYQQLLRKHIGQTYDAMFIRKFDDESQEALLINQIPVIVRTARDLIGEFKNVKIDSLSQGKLFGKII